jgi:hypothetical protein
MRILGCLRITVRDGWVVGGIHLERFSLVTITNWHAAVCYAMHVGREQGHSIGPLGLCSLGQSESAPCFG